MMAEAARFMPTEEEAMVRQTAADFVAGRMPIRALRQLRDTGAAFDRETWREMTALGWTGISVPERFGGSGLGIRALGSVIEEMGRTLAAAPLASTALVAATVIRRFATPEAAERWLPAIARGEVIAALAVDEHSTEQMRDTTTDGARLSGIKRYVADGANADLLLVSAQYGGQAALALVRTDAPGVTVAGVNTIDGLGMAEIGFVDAPVDALLQERKGRDPVDHALDCARIGLSAEMLGASAAAFETTLDYLRMRRQFGQLIGSFQALQHRAAKLFIELELTRSCVLAALDALHHDRSDTPMLASLAKASASELMRTMSYEMIQLHGGIGMTDAHDAGLYLKRGRVAALLHGDGAFHIDRYARLGGY